MWRYVPLAVFSALTAFGATAQPQQPQLNADIYVGLTAASVTATDSAKRALGGPYKYQDVPAASSLFTRATFPDPATPGGLPIVPGTYRVAVICSAQGAISDLALMDPGSTTLKEIVRAMLSASACRPATFGGDPVNSLDILSLTFY